MHQCHAMQLLFGLVTQRHLFPVGERARCVTRSNNGCKKDYAYYRFSNREKITIDNIYLHVNFFTVGLDNAVRVGDKMWVVYKEIIRDRAKSITVKLKELIWPQKWGQNE